MSLANDEVVEENTVTRIPFVFRPEDYDRERTDTKTVTIIKNQNFGS